MDVGGSAKLVQLHNLVFVGSHEDPALLYSGTDSFFTVARSARGHCTGGSRGEKIAVTVATRHRGVWRALFVLP